MWGGAKNFTLREKEKEEIAEEQFASEQQT